MDKFCADTGIDIDMHTTLPAVASRTVRRPGYRSGLRPPRVKSISASGHKRSGSATAAAIWRDEEALRRNWCSTLTTWGQIGTFAINSRPAGQVIAQYRNSCASVVKAIPKYRTPLPVAAYLADEIAKLGPYEFICTGRLTKRIPAGLLQTEKMVKIRYTLYDLSERLRFARLAGSGLHSAVKPPTSWWMRIMCRRGFEMDFALNCCWKTTKLP
ncbi:hypothetical protein MXS87_10235 [Escherichia coli]|nr:hypothetical protein [Escherichia coli]